MTALFRRLASGEDGATIVEYVLLAALIAVAAAGSINLLGQSVTGKYDSLERSVPGA